MTEQYFQEAIWIAHTLFAKGSASGSSSNISFRAGNQIYISGSGTCFGTLTEEQFACLTIEGEQRNKIKPSKEFPLHQVIYQAKPDIRGVIHTHSFYATLYSCMAVENPADVIPSYTPYLKMKVGTIGLIPYAKPGSQQLFSYEGEGYAVRRLSIKTAWPSSWRKKPYGCILRDRRTGGECKNGMVSEGAL